MTLATARLRRPLANKVGAGAILHAYLPGYEPRTRVCKNTLVPPLQQVNAIWRNRHEPPDRRCCPRGRGCCPRGRGCCPRGRGCCPRGRGCCSRGRGCRPRGSIGVRMHWRRGGRPFRPSPLGAPSVHAGQRGGAGLGRDASPGHDGGGLLPWPGHRDQHEHTDNGRAQPAPCGPRRARQTFCTGQLGPHGRQDALLFLRFEGYAVCNSMQRLSKILLKDAHLPNPPTVAQAN